jgi:hypothetical protein
MSSYWLLENTASPVATPTFSPASGSYVQPASVTLSDAGATIYYTTDGSTPTTASTVYTGPIVLGVGTTIIQAIATAAGFTQSAVGSATYAVSAVAPSPPPPAATPAFSPAGGGYVAPVSVTITDSTFGATIYYTTDGSIPTTSSALYTGPIALAVGTTTVKAIATVTALSNSAVGSASYALSASPPAPPPPPPPSPVPVRVRATAAGYFEGVYRDIGDVFDISDTSDFTDSAQSQVPVGNPDYPEYGWMVIVPSSTPLFSFASSGLSSPRTSPRRTVY